MTHKCRGCGAGLKTVFADLGRSPLSNEFKTAEQLEVAEETYRLCVFVCDECKFVQLPNHVYPGKIFNENYAYFSSVSKSWVEHAGRYATKMLADPRLDLYKDSLVVEVGGNDGYLLQHFKDFTCVLNVEPSANVAWAAQAKGIPTRIDFMSAELGDELYNEYGEAALIHGSNVLAHTPNIHSFIAGCQALLSPGGTITFEFPWLLNLINKMQIDTIYHEHYSYLSLYALEPILEQHGLEVYDLEEVPSQGGSLRLYIRRLQPAKITSEALIRARIAEHAAALHEIDTYKQFAKKCVNIKADALDFFINSHFGGDRVVGYSAPAKATTLLNYIGVGPELLPYIIEDSPAKIGKFVPGVQIPILAPEMQGNDPTDVVVFAWNLIDEIKPKIKALWPDAVIWTLLPKVQTHS
jgi:hypothetical protein